MLDSMVGAPGARPFKGRVIYGAKTIKAIRKDLGLSQGELADLLSVEIEVVKSWEQRRRVPDALMTKLLFLLQKHPRQMMVWMRRADQVLRFG
jgi:DNA-binding XRE family transcriptional regulator